MKISLLVLGLSLVAFSAGVVPAFAVEAAPQSSAIPKSLPAAIAFAAAALAAGYAIAKAGSAGLAAAAERPELRTLAIIITALGEALAIYGIVLAILLSG